MSGMNLCFPVSDYIDVGKVVCDCNHIYLLCLASCCLFKTFAFTSCGFFWFFGGLTHISAGCVDLPCGVLTSSDVTLDAC